MLTPYQFASNNPVLNIDLDGLEGYNPNSGGYTLYDVIFNGAKPSQWYNDPGDVRWVNENANLLYIGNDYANKILYSHDVLGNPLDGRGKSGAISDAGVDVMAYFTMARFFKVLTAGNVLEKQMATNKKAMGKAGLTPEQKAANAVPKDIHQSTLKAIFRGKGIFVRGNAAEMFGSLSGNRYAEMEWVGRLDNGFFPTVDYVGNKLAVQLKTFDAKTINVKSYEKFIDKLASVVENGHVTGKTQSFMVNDGELDILMPQKYNNRTLNKSLWEKLGKIQKYGIDNGIKVNIINNLKGGN